MDAVWGQLQKPTQTGSDFLSCCVTVTERPVLPKICDVLGMTHTSTDGHG